MTAPMTVPRNGLSTDPWTTVFPSADLVDDRGVCALVGARHVAVFRLSVSGELVAIDNVDPFSGASVLSRGLVGSTEIGGIAVAYVASPLRKQRFDLRTGCCLDDPDVRVDRFDVRETAGQIEARPVHEGNGAGSSWGNVEEIGA